MAEDTSFLEVMEYFSRKPWEKPMKTFQIAKRIILIE